MPGKSFPRFIPFDIVRPLRVEGTSKVMDSGFPDERRFQLES